MLPYPINSAPHRKKSRASLWMALILLTALAGGGYMVYQNHAEASAKKLAAERRDKARRQALAERAARLQAERERMKRAAEEKARQEAEAADRARREADEAERLRRQREEESRKQPDTAPEQPREPEPRETPVVPTTPSIYEAELILCGGRSNGAENVKRYEAMLDHLLDKGDFEAFAQAFASKIKNNVGELISSGVLRYPTYKNSRILVRAADLCLLIDKAGAASLSALLSEPKGKEFFNWLLRGKNPPLRLLTRAAAAQQAMPEHMAHTLAVWKGLWAQTPPKDRAKYTNLALACSLLPPRFEQSSGSVRQPKTPLLNVPQLYAYFREMDAARKLLTDVQTMSVSNLLYVVNVRLPKSEFDWVMANMKYDRENWGAAYGSIRYRMDRAAQGKDPYTTYEFAEIRKEGGVCRDQGYFAATTAKCKGIPSVYITGDGDRGGHAWIAHMVDDNTWRQTGSYGYKTGRFSNPCSGRIMHESALLNQTKKTTDEKLAPAHDAMALSDLLARLGCTEESWAAARHATNAFPAMTAAWNNLVQVMGRDEEHLPELAAWKKIVLSLQREGRNNPELLDIAADVEDRYIAGTRSASAQKNSIARSMRQLKRSAGDGRSDLIVEAIERQAEAMVASKDYRGLASLYKKAMKEHSGRGDIVQQLLGQYLSLVRDDPAKTLTLAKDAEAIYNKNIRTETGDYFKLSKEVAIQQMIARAYALGGNEKKASALQREADERLKAAKDRFR